ncbi:Calcineurin-like phosphoesterase [Globisporangium polare]
MKHSAEAAVTRVGIAVVLLLTTVLLTTVSAAAIDDRACVYKISSFSCSPKALCSYQYKLGDLTPDQSCRVKKGVNKLPQQMHLAYAGTTAGTAMTVSWATFASIADNAVWIGASAFTLERIANLELTSTAYYSEGDYSLLHHHAVLSGLTPNTKYYYKVGSAGDSASQSQVASFVTARPASDATAFTVAVYGDHGDGKYAEDTTELVNTLGAQIDFIYHIGDVSYADNDYLVPSQSLGFFYEEVYNKWMNSLTPIMSQVPYMVLVGNHEAECHSPNCQISKTKKDKLGNYTAFNTRWRMPSKESGGTLNMWHSFDHGPVHFISISAETDYTGAPTNEYTLTNKNGNFGNQLAWVEADLKKAAANRANVPWIVLGLHRPLYSLNSADGAGNPTGQPQILQAAFEELFIKYGVDVVVAGHQHSYERHLPVARGVAMTEGISADKNTYTNPKAPVYIVTGAAGNVEDHTKKPSSTAAWNVASDFENWGISTVKVSRQSLEWKFLASASQKVLDQFLMIKN